MKSVCRMGKIEEVIKELDLHDIPADLLECDEGYQIIASGWWIAVPDLGISLHEGVFCNYDKTKRAYLPDFHVSIIRKSGERIKEGEWIWYGQDSFVNTLADYLYGEMEMSRIEQLTCVTCIPDSGSER